MVGLKKEGKIVYLGLSEISAATLRRAYAVHPISAVEIEYSPFALDIESEQIKLLKTYRELGVVVIAYSPLGRGMEPASLRAILMSVIYGGSCQNSVPRTSRRI
jgi:aryl-alcohol dehydrogenase-like predicted oxidoreductase